MNNEAPRANLLNVTLELAVFMGLLYVLERVGALPSAWEYVAGLIRLVMGG